LDFFANGTAGGGEFGGGCGETLRYRKRDTKRSYMTSKIYNLEFPNFIDELTVDGYTFRRISDYKEAHEKLWNLVPSSGAEFATVIQTGSHQITATVDKPEMEKSASLPWGDPDPKRLLDILLLLSIFTGRNVFEKHWQDDTGVAILADHRGYQFGGELILSLPTESAWRDKQTGQVLNDKDIEGKSLFDYERINLGFEKGINKVLQTITSESWKKTYADGHFLFLFKQAIQRQFLETAFIISWSIWEHLFTLHNRNWLDKKSIEKMGGKEKITFVYNKYFATPSQVSAETEPLTRTRNRIIHFGMKATEADNDSMERFVRMTERLVAIILDLRPSFVLEGAESLRKIF
jgi:hypothetical protein